MGYSPWGHKELDMTEWLTQTHTHTHLVTLLYLHLPLPGASLLNVLQIYLSK